MEASPQRWTRMPTTERSSKRTLLFGGSFDPVHMGHMHLMKMARKFTSYERIILMVARISNFKQESRPASGQDRIAMLKLAVDEFLSENPDFPIEIVISPMEIERSGVSYTYDTVKAVYDSFDIEGKLGFMMGDDLLPSLHKWYRYEELKKIVTFVCFTRDGNKVVKDSDADIFLIESPIVTASSTDIRNGDYSMLPSSVRAYIEKHNLYR